MSRVVRVFAAGSIVMAMSIGGPAAVTQASSRKTPKTTRTESREYAGSSGVQLLAGDISACVSDQGCFTLTAEPKEEYVSVTVTDSSGTPAPFSVSYHGATTSHCGQTDEPLWLNDAAEIAVSIRTAVADCAGVGTTGSLTATFSNRR